MRRKKISPPDEASDSIRPVKKTDTGFPIKRGEGRLSKSAVITAKKLANRSHELKETLRSGPFSEKFNSIKDEVASEMFVNAYVLAHLGSEKMTEYLLSATSKDMDPIVRREEAKGKALAVNELFKKLLNSPEADPLKLIKTETK
jgi:hypothetical protein